MTSEVQISNAIFVRGKLKLY